MSVFARHLNLDPDIEIPGRHLRRTPPAALATAATSAHPTAAAMPPAVASTAAPTSTTSPTSTTATSCAAAVPRGLRGRPGPAAAREQHGEQGSARVLHGRTVPAARPNPRGRCAPGCPGVVKRAMPAEAASS